MRKPDLHGMATPDLVALFAKVTVDQDEALLGNRIAKFNRLFGVMIEISDELKGREGDQRTALLSLFEYPNMQVRLQAAKLTLAVAPVEARRQLKRSHPRNGFRKPATPACVSIFWMMGRSSRNDGMWGGRRICFGQPAEPPVR
ncbi:DUF2019 domain-containing protein [Rhodopseudomonas palustris]|uniref:DUF2019 domain-containing protein n=1 Tax=Rhodopseudomonas palustris TaxID=1076 RepID=UPI003CC82CE2